MHGGPVIFIDLNRKVLLSLTAERQALSQRPFISRLSEFGEQDDVAIHRLPLPQRAQDQPVVRQRVPLVGRAR